ncbi:hypothetical protein, partial [Salmonella enterica]|uniref:hypothetical protein n=1 Tax=Salmonella enterica TaxID=28901 RepID=UPI000CBDABCD
FKDFVQFLDNHDLKHFSKLLKSDDRSLYITVDNVKFIFANGADVPVYVEQGIADLGVACLDIITEIVLTY